MAWKKRNGGRPRIHAGELGFQDGRLAWDYSPLASAAGHRFLLSCGKGLAVFIDPSARDRPHAH
jgi:hypothetical protein